MYEVRVDDYPSVESAWAVARDNDSVLRFGAGTYTITSALSGWASPKVMGAGFGKTTLNLPDGGHLIDEPDLMSSFHLSGVTTSGGAGAVRHRFTGANSGQRTFKVEECQFLDYTDVAVQVQSSDMPRWRVRDCLFRAANDTGTIGFEHRGLANNLDIEGCTFQRNRAHIKLLVPQDATIRKCEFFQWNGSPVNPRSAIWIVPRATGSNAGDGFVVTMCKFGNENIDSSDYRILYADDDGGWPDLVAGSTGYVMAHQVFGNKLSGSTGASPPMVYSMTERTRGCQFGPNVCHGTAPDYAVEYATYDAAERFGTVVNLHSHDFATVPASNDPGL